MKASNELRGCKSRVSGGLVPHFESSLREYPENYYVFEQGLGEAPESTNTQYGGLGQNVLEFSVAPL